MTERTEWPTPEKIERLRAEGVVSYSSAATASFVMGAVVVVASMFADEWGEAILRYREHAVRGELLSGWLAALMVVRNALLALAGVVGGVILLSAVGQTHFLFMPSRLAPNLGRLMPLRGWSIGAPVKAILMSGIRLALGLGVGALLFGVFFRDMAGILNHGLDYVVGHTGESLRGVFGWIATVAFGGGVVGWGLGWLLFRIRHRMTRAEVLADRAER